MCHIGYAITSVMAPIQSKEYDQHATCKEKCSFCTGLWWYKSVVFAQAFGGTNILRNSREREEWYCNLG
ncbi:hypothetical protein DAI22_03g098600 [Oryza sativa Japonica Group]|jgi:hypothetical protein|nr:hypothetical protein DAI22_03g098600 [Oryza sativa Japonica Group]